MHDFFHFPEMKKLLPEEEKKTRFRDWRFFPNQNGFGGF